MIRQYDVQVVAEGDALAEGTFRVVLTRTGRVVTAIDVPDSALGPRKVEIDIMYNKERYRPTYDKKAGLPIFLTHSGL